MDYKGGTLFIEDHMIFIEIPENAVASNHIVQVQAAASLYGPYIIPDEYEQISAFLWMGANYTFRKPVKIIMQHHSAVLTEEDKCDITVLTASDQDMSKEDGQIFFRMHSDNSYDIEVEGSVCVYKVQHFCSDCIVKRKTKNLPDRIAVLHYFPTEYQSLTNVRSEVCFCYDTEFCKAVSQFLCVQV